MKKLIVLFIAVVAIFCFSSCKKATPSDTVKGYYEALMKGDFEKAMTYTDITDKEEIQQHIDKMKGCNLKVSEYEILSETLADDGQSAVVAVKYTSSSSWSSKPSESNKTLDLVKKDGKWVIHE